MRGTEIVYSLYRKWQVKSSGHPYRTQAAKQATTTQKPLSLKQKHGSSYNIPYSLVMLFCEMYLHKDFSKEFGTISFLTV